VFPIREWEFPPKISKNCFQKFFRVKSQETEKITGTGLGLWITTQIVKAMKGTISVESIKGKGTDFIVYIPHCEMRTPRSWEKYFMLYFSHESDTEFLF